MTARRRFSGYADGARLIEDVTIIVAGIAVLILVGRYFRSSSLAVAVGVLWTVGTVWRFRARKNKPR